MSKRIDLPEIGNVAAAAEAFKQRPAVARGAALAAAAGVDGDDVLEAVRAVGAQVKERVSKVDERVGAIDQRVSGLHATLLHTQQALAKLELNGGATTGNRGSMERVSASVLQELEGSLEDLRSGKVKSLRASIPTLYHAATITSPGVPIQGDRDDEVYAPLRAFSSVRDLLVTRTTSAPAIEYIKATRTGSAAIQAAEGDAKAELSMGFSLQTSHVRTIAAWVPASRQVLDDASMLADVIDTQLRDAVRSKEDQQLLNGDGTGSNLLGLIPSATAYSRAVVGDTPLDAIRRGVTQLQLARGVPTGLVINPVGLELLELQKDDTGRYMLTLEVTGQNGRTTVWRVPTVVTDAIGQDSWLLGDFNRAARLYDRMQAMVEVATQHADFFTRNLVAILCEERVALTIPRPDLTIVGSFAA